MIFTVAVGSHFIVAEIVAEDEVIRDILGVIGVGGLIVLLT